MVETKAYTNEKHNYIDQHLRTFQDEEDNAPQNLEPCVVIFLT